MVLSCYLLTFDGVMSDCHMAQAHLKTDRVKHAIKQTLAADQRWSKKQRDKYDTILQTMAEKRMTWWRRLFGYTESKARFDLQFYGFVGEPPCLLTHGERSALVSLLHLLDNTQDELVMLTEVEVERVIRGGRVLAEERRQV